MGASLNLLKTTLAAFILIITLSGFGFGFGSSKLPETKNGEKVSLFDNGDEAIRLFNSQPGAPEMDRNQVVQALTFALKSKFNANAIDATNEVDASKKEAKLNAVYQQFIDYSNNEPLGTVVAVVQPYTVEPYDVQKKEFRVCLNGDCDLSNTRVTQGNFELHFIKSDAGKIAFSPGDVEARRMDADFALNNRRGLAILFAHIADVESGNPNRINLNVFRVALKNTANTNVASTRDVYDSADKAGILLREYGANPRSAVKPSTQKDLLLGKLGDNSAGTKTPSQSPKLQLSAEARSKFKKLGFQLTDGSVPDTGYFALLERKDGSWRVKSFSESRPEIAKSGGEELLVFNVKSHTVTPDFRDFALAASGKAGEFVCATGALRSDKANARTGYNPCDSYLTSIQSANLATNAFMTVFTLGLNVATGTSSRTVALDPDKVLEVIEQSKVVENELAAAEDKKKTAKYHSDYQNIDSAESLDLFVRNYAGSDPENLIPTAESKRDFFIEQDAQRKQALESKRAMEVQQAQLAAERKRIEDQLAAERRRIEDEKRQQADIQRKAKRDQVVAAFRANLTIGSETSCGPVINIRLPMVQIYSNVQLSGYSAEPWLNIATVYPASVAGCANTNGQLTSRFYD